MNVAGLRLPLRGTSVALVAIFMLLVDYYHPLALLNWPIGAAASTAIERIGLFLAVPMLMLVVVSVHMPMVMFDFSMDMEMVMTFPEQEYDPHHHDH